VEYRRAARGPLDEDGAVMSGKGHVRRAWFIGEARSNGCRRSRLYALVDAIVRFGEVVLARKVDLGRR